MIHILIVEDDQNIARMIETAVSIVGYRTSLCSNGATAVEMIMEHDYDLILLDVMLPGLDGFSVIQKIQGRNIPTIFISALQDVSDKVKGLRLGAEDYIVKPFEAVELLARIEVVLRRSNKGPKSLSYMDITVNIEEHMVKKCGKAIALTPKEFDVLVFFIQNTDIVLTRERLLSKIWGYTYQGESRTVDTHVQQVRRKMGLKDKLVSVPKLGYRLNRP
ncbi:MAG: response regulator transcription factor [Lachnospiraceae bacterium]